MCSLRRKKSELASDFGIARDQSKMQQPIPFRPHNGSPKTFWHRDVAFYTGHVDEENNRGTNMAHERRKRGILWRPTIATQKGTQQQ